ncbi:hypothetical protein L7F22_019101 [Adiantum nelumboides]|nr:hypothetical protein [Adiantum nelumboides]
MSSPEDGEKAYALAMKHSQSGNLESALKWSKKALSIDPNLTKAKILLTSLEKGHMPGYEEGVGSSSTGSKTNGMNGHTNNSEGLKKRSTASSSAAARESPSTPQREYTEVQMKIVKQVNKSGRENDYYGVLGLKKSDEPDENAIKKGYRKLALQLHPDKNGAPGADEAFKIVSKAFTILSDADKRAMYDRYGGDPDSRGGGGSSTAGRAAGFGGAGPAFRTYGPGMGGAEIDPNDLFNMFFGGGMGNGFGGTTFSFGGPGGVHMHQFGGQNAFHARQARQGPRRAANNNESTPMLLQLLPLLILGLFSLLSYAPTLFSTPDPQFDWTPSAHFRTERHTQTHNVKYYVDQTTWHTHPWVAAASKINVKDSAVQAEANRASSKLQDFERRVENQFKNSLYRDCQRRREYQERRINAAQGTLFGIGADREAEKRIRAEKYDSCERLRDFGINFSIQI